MAPADAQGAPVLVFANGGGFIMGNKTTPGSPFYDSIAAFAARHGMIGVNMTYRLAPGASLAERRGRHAFVVDWLRANVGAYGGDPERIYLMGQSAGAVHVASYLAHREARIAGAILVSRALRHCQRRADRHAQSYYGEDLSTWPATSNVAGMVASPVPQMLSVCEYDPVDFHRQGGRFRGGMGGCAQPFSAPALAARA